MSVFKYEDLLEEICFKKITRGERLTMNGSENAGKFTLYKVPHKKIDKAF